MTLFTSPAFTLGGVLILSAWILFSLIDRMRAR